MGAHHQALGLEQEERLPYGRARHVEVGRQLGRRQVLPGCVVAPHDAVAEDVAYHAGDRPRRAPDRH